MSFVCTNDKITTIKLRIDKTFTIILGSILILRIALNIQNRTVTRLKQENVYCEYCHLEEYALAQEQWLWTIFGRISLEDRWLTELDGKLLSTLPPERFVVNYCNLAGNSVSQN